MGQNLDAKNYTYFDTDRVSYTTYGPNSTKPSKEAPNAKESFSPSLLTARPKPPSPRLRVRPSAPPALGFEPFAFGPRPSTYPLDRRLAALRRPASGSLILMTSPTRPRQLQQAQAASPSPSQCQHPSISAKEAATGYYSHRSTALGCSYRMLRQRKMAVAAVTAAERCDYGFVMQLIVNYIAY